MLLTAVSLLFAVDINANLDGRWIQHPAAALRSEYKQSQVDRIIDGNRYVYFSVRGGAFIRDDKQLDMYAYQNLMDPLTLFRYDKESEWCEGCIVPVSRDVDLSGAFHQTLNYSPMHRVLALAFEDGSVDFIYDDGRHVKSNALVGFSRPGNMVYPYSITFDDSNPVIYLAGQHGLATINIENGELESLNSFGKSVGFAARVGENMVVVAGDITPFLPGKNQNNSLIYYQSFSASTYIYPVNKVPNELTDPISGGDNLQVIMPLTDNTFAALAPGNSDIENIVKLFTIDGDQVKVETLIVAASVDNAATADFRHLFRTDGLVGATKEGYAIQNNGAIILIKKGVEIDYSASAPIENFKEISLSTISKSTLSATEKNAKCATFDGEEVWFYEYSSGGLDAKPRGFYSRHYASDRWDMASNLVEPSGPKVCYPIYGTYHPSYGMLFRGPGSHFDENSKEKDYFFAYKNGKWQDLTYGANNPKYQIPTDNAKYIAIDPLNESWIWGTSNRNGVFRMNLEDYDDFFMLSTTNKAASTETTYPGLYRFFTNQTAFSGLISTSNIDFDNSGNLWFARFWITTGNDMDYEDITLSKTPLYYYTLEQRKEIVKAGNKPPLIEPKEIVIPYLYLSQNSALSALKSNGNENMIAITRIASAGFHIYPDVFPPVLLDHKGTLDDASDDILVYIKNLYDEDGKKFSFEGYYSMFEDVDLGELWLNTKSGPIILDPQEIIQGNMVGRRPHITKRDGMDVDELPFEELQINNMDTDPKGRKWISTEQGLFCLSRDGKELLGKYDMENAPLPSDDIRGVACDKSTGAVFIMTRNGIVEFQPDGSSVSIPAGTHLSVSPEYVYPGYNGYVAISGAEAGAIYIVEDSEGNRVVELATPENGMMQWNRKDINGDPVTSGKYNIRRSDRDERNPLVILGN